MFQRQMEREEMEPGKDFVLFTHAEEQFHRCSV